MNEQTAISGSLALNSAPHVIMIPASGPVRTRKLRVAALRIRSTMNQPSRCSNSSAI